MMLNDWFDATLPISERMVVWPGDPAPRLEPVATLAQDGVALTRLVLSSHCGTHVDAPAHFLAGGATVDMLPLAALVGPVQVIDCPGQGPVDWRELEAVEGERLLIRTGASAGLKAGLFDTAYRGLSVAAATRLASRVRLVGIDTLSIEPFQAGDYPVHRTLLGAGVVIVEGVDLERVRPGRYDMTALPLRLVGCDGSPARVLLRKRSSDGNNF